MGEGTPADGEHRKERTSPLFDPVAGMRVMADIQAEGLRAAGELLERVLGKETEGNGRPAAGGDYTTLVTAWTDLMQRTVSELAEPGGRGGVTVGVDGTGMGPSVRLMLEEASADPSASTEVWLHNGTSSAVGPLALRCGELRDSDGKKLKGVKVKFKPRAVEALPPRSSRAIKVSLALSGALRPGVYRGTIQARGAPKLWLPLEVAIAPC